LIDIRVDPWPDPAALGELLRAVWGEASSAGSRGVLERSLAHVCAYDGERLVGFVNVAWDGGAHAFILDTSVHPSHRHQGIGTGLVRAAAEVARERGARWLHVDYEARYSAFYERCGFRPTAAGIMRLG
jgi:GNAT superfamily N-acetyltransferase